MVQEIIIFDSFQRILVTPTYIEFDESIHFEGNHILAIKCQTGRDGIKRKYFNIERTLRIYFIRGDPRLILAGDFNSCLISTNCNNIFLRESFRSQSDISLDDEEELFNLSLNKMLDEILYLQLSPA